MKPNETSIKETKRWDNNCWTRKKMASRERENSWLPSFLFVVKYTSSFNSHACLSIRFLSCPYGSHWYSHIMYVWRSTFSTVFIDRQWNCRWLFASIRMMRSCWLPNTHLFKRNRTIYDDDSSSYFFDYPLHTCLCKNKHCSIIDWDVTLVLFSWNGVSWNFFFLFIDELSSV